MVMIDDPSPPPQKKNRFALFFQQFTLCTDWKSKYLEKNQRKTKRTWHKLLDTFCINILKKCCEKVLIKRKYSILNFNHSSSLYTVRVTVGEITVPFFIYTKDFFIFRSHIVSPNISENPSSVFLLPSKRCILLLFTVFLDKKHCPNLHA